MTTEEREELRWKWETVHEEIKGKTRWHVTKWTVLRDETGKLWGLAWNEAATEYQEHEYFSDPVEVEAYEETVTRYRPKPSAPELVGDE